MQWIRVGGQPPRPMVARYLAGDRRRRQAGPRRGQNPPRSGDGSAPLNHRSAPRRPPQDRELRLLGAADRYQAARAAPQLSPDRTGTPAGINQHGPSQPSVDDPVRPLVRYLADRLVEDRSCTGAIRSRIIPVVATGPMAHRWRRIACRWGRPPTNPVCRDAARGGGSCVTRGPCAQGKIREVQGSFRILGQR